MVISHAQCAHPRTPSGRAACRRAHASGNPGASVPIHTAGSAGSVPLNGRKARRGTDTSPSGRFFRKQYPHCPSCMDDMPAVDQAGLTSCCSVRYCSGGLRSWHPTPGVFGGLMVMACCPGTALEQGVSVGEENR